MDVMASLSQQAGAGLESTLICSSRNLNFFQQGGKHMVCGSVSGLPGRIQKILCRFGVLLGEPEVFGGACGGDVTAIACFQTLEAAEAADSPQ